MNNCNFRLQVLECQNLSTKTWFRAANLFQKHSIRSEDMDFNCNCNFTNPCYFFLNNSETVKALNLAFCSIQ